MIRILLIVSVVCFAFGCSSAPEAMTEEPVVAEEPAEMSGATYVGWLADAKCANAGKAATDDHAGCAQKCVEGGEAIVLVAEEGGNIYMLDDQEAAKPHAGHKVTVAGTLDGETIAVASISM